MEEGRKSSTFQRILDFLGQPVPVGEMTTADAEAYQQMVKGYWGAIAARDGVQRPEVHQHLHLHGVDEKNMRKAKILNKRVSELTPQDIAFLKNGYEE